MPVDDHTIFFEHVQKKHTCPLVMIWFITMNSYENNRCVCILGTVRSQNTMYTLWIIVLFRVYGIPFRLESTYARSTPRKDSERKLYVRTHTNKLQHLEEKHSSCSFGKKKACREYVVAHFLRLLLISFGLHLKYFLFSVEFGCTNFSNGHLKNDWPCFPSLHQLYIHSTISADILLA